MIRRVEKPYETEEIRSLLDPLVEEWFFSRFTDFTEAQKYAIPLIHRGEHVLVSSPTGSGKTLAGFLSIINELFILAKEGRLEDRIYCVYISPLKALANDIHRNLEVPLQEITALAERKGVKVPRIRVGVRSGDTSQAERQRHLKRPPHIFITTPESLSLALTAPRFRMAFQKVKWVIVDEVHEVAGNKRGVMLSLNLERLQALSPGIVRIGLSATQAPIEEIGQYLVGVGRDVNVVEVDVKKRMDLKVITPVENLHTASYDYATERMYDLLVEMINEHRTTLVFTNTRSGAERVAYRLRERGIEKLEAHHGSLSKEIRLDVEERLKRGDLKVVVTSTSLELGIDIGYIDLVVQIGSPKSVAKGIQRVGRSGHKYMDISKGRFMVLEMDDLVECAVLVKCAREGKIDRISIPQNCLDVLAQVLVGMSLERRWGIREAYELVRRSYCYRNLSYETFMGVLRYLAGSMEEESSYAKIWMDERDGVFGRKRGTRMIYFTNVGTIPDEADYTVYTSTGRRIGELSEKFVENLKPGDIFVLGSRTYEFISRRGARMYVRDAGGRKPTVPSWAGEMLPRSFDLSMEVARFRGAVEDRLKRGEDVVGWLMEEYNLDEGAARSISSYVEEQMADVVPTDRRLFVEGYVDEEGRRNIIFHYPFGRRVNDALSRAYAYAASHLWNASCRLSVTDDGFMLTLSKEVPIGELVRAVTPDNLEDYLRNAIRNTELFKQRFRHCAVRGLMVLRRYKGSSITVARQQLRSERILDALADMDFPLIEETYNEIFNIAMDIGHAEEVLRWIEEGRVEVVTKDYSPEVSVFAHSIILAGVSDIVLMEDRTALLRELQMRILRRVLGEEALRGEFEKEAVEGYFRAKVGEIEDPGDVVEFVRRAGMADLLREGVRTPYAFGGEKVRDAVIGAINSGALCGVWTPAGIRWVCREDLPLAAALYAAEPKREYPEWEGCLTSKEIARLLKVKVRDAAALLREMARCYLAVRCGMEGTRFRWERCSPGRANREAALREFILRTLSTFGPMTAEELAGHLRAKRGDVEEALASLVDEGLVVEGRFTPSLGTQYMLSTDYRALRGATAGGEEGIRLYRFEKLMKPVDTVEEYFERYLIASHPHDVFLRCREFSWEEWERMRMDGEILLGRFLGNALFYIHRKHLPLFIPHFRREEMDDLDREVLKHIRRGLDTPRKISRALRGAKPSLMKLERNLYLLRGFTPGEDGRRYVPSPDVEGGDPAALPFALIRAIGPLRRDFLLHALGEHCDAVLKALVTAEHLRRVLTERGEYLVAAEEDIRAGGGVRRAVISARDVIAYPMAPEILERFGRGFNYLLVDGGEIRGAALVEERDGFVLLTEAIGDADAWTTWLRDTGFFRADVRVIAPSNLSRSALRRGYRRVGEWYAWGNVSTEVFTWEEFFSLVLWTQGVHVDSRFKSPLEAVRALHGLRSDMEAAIRCVRRTPLEKYFKSGMVYRGMGIPPLVTYMDRETAALIQAIKDVEITDRMKVVMALVNSHPMWSRETLCERSPLGYERTREALNALYRSTHLLMDHEKRYIPVRRKYGRDYAVRKFVEDFLHRMGFVNPSMVERYTGGFISAREALAALRDCERGGIAVKGFFLKNDMHLWWTTREALELVEKVRFPPDWEFVLHPHDMISLAFRDRFPAGYHVFRGTEHLGTVKATMRRYEVVVRSRDVRPEVLDIFREFMRSLNIAVRGDAL